MRKPLDAKAYEIAQAERQAAGYVEDGGVYLKDGSWYLFLRWAKPNGKEEVTRDRFGSARSAEAFYIGIKTALGMVEIDCVVSRATPFEYYSHGGHDEGE